MEKQNFKPLTEEQVGYANQAVRRFLSDLEEHGVHIVYNRCDAKAVFVPADFVNTYAEDGCVEFDNGISDKIFAKQATGENVHPWSGWLADEETDPETHEVTRWSIDVNTAWKELGKTETEVPADRKYVLTDVTIEVDGHTLHRIRAIRDITDPGYPGWQVVRGQLGGYVESEANLSHDGAAWVDVDAKVFENAKVTGNALVFGDAVVRGEARVFENAKVNGKAQVYGKATVGGSATVEDNARVEGSAMVYGYAQVYDNAQVHGHAKVYGEAWVYDNADVYGGAQVCGDSQVHGAAKLCGVSEPEKNISNSADEPQDSPQESPDIETRLTTLEGRVDSLARDMVNTVKEIEAIKKQIARKPKTPKVLLKNA